MRPTMADVGAKVGVSVSTVSLVLNGKPGISQELRDQVMKAVQELGYRLPGRETLKLPPETKSVTLIHYASPQPQVQAGVTGIFVDFVSSIRDYFQDRNVNMTLIANYRDGDRENLGYHLLESDALLTDGFILMGISSQNSPLLQRLIEASKPVVVLSRNWPTLPVSTVSQDHARHANIALDYLASLGHRKIAFVAREVDQEFDWYETRLACYRAKMKSWGKWDESFISVASNAAEATKTVLARHPETTAIFAVHDENAVMVMSTLLEMGYRIPKQISVIGLDNSAQAPKKFPALTTVGFAHNEIGRLAADLLLEQMNNPDVAYGKLFVASRLIERNSCAPPSH
jgi:DNA-binding LacI/PurR family transcriptional regulator